MAAIRSKDTKPEMIVRRGLWKRGFRYRLNDRRLPGHPDLVLKKYRTCVFVNGCFWHGHELRAQNDEFRMDNEESLKSSACCKIPKTNREFWVAKIRRNMKRDREEQRKLADMGWHCITIWECELKPHRREETLEALAFTLNHIWLKDQIGCNTSVRRVKKHNGVLYPQLEVEEEQLPIAAENGDNV